MSNKGKKPAAVVPKKQPPPPRAADAPKPLRAEKRAGLEFPVGAVKSALRNSLKGYHLSQSVAVAATTVTQMLTARMIEKADEASRLAHVGHTTARHITEQHVELGARKDDDLRRILNLPVLLAPLGTGKPIKKAKRVASAAAVADEAGAEAE